MQVNARTHERVCVCERTERVLPCKRKPSPNRTHNTYGIGGKKEKEKKKIAQAIATVGLVEVRVCARVCTLHLVEAITRFDELEPFGNNDG